jgi:hypothetical protein
MVIAMAITRKNETIASMIGRVLKNERKANQSCSNGMVVAMMVLLLLV